MNVVVDSLLTTYTKVGTGPKIILFLHGWADTSKTFEQLTAQVVKENNDYTAVLLDLPGFGGTQVPPNAWGLDGYADFVSHFLKKTGLKVDTLVGHSNGGAIAIHGLAQHSLEAQKLVLIASAGIRSNDTRKQALRLAAKPAKLALKLAPKTTQKRIRSKLYGAIGSDYLVAEHMEDTFKRVVSMDVTDEARTVTVPTCIIYGEDDQATPLAYGKIFAHVMPNAKLHTVELAGHFVHQEQVYKVARLITEFLS